MRKANTDEPDWNIGYTTRNHLCLDFDNTSYFKVANLVKILMRNYPEIGDCITLVSSRPPQLERWKYPPGKPPQKQTRAHNYHVVFNNRLSYERSCKIIETLAYLGVLDEAYIKIREMRNDMTLRVSQTVNVEQTKPKPALIEYIQNPYCKINGKGIFLYNRLRKAL